jgi:lipopolysaccharide biosynthesis glycosyltransferase
MYKITFLFDFKYFKHLINVINSIYINEINEYKHKIEYYLTFFGTIEEQTTVFDTITKLFPNNTFYIKNVIIEYPNIHAICCKLYNLRGSGKHIQNSLVYARMYLTTIWTEITDILLYLDIDIIVLHPISKLFDDIYNNPNHIIYGVTNSKMGNNYRVMNINLQDIVKTNTNIFNKYSNKHMRIITRRKINLTKPAFNGGVWAINLDKCRKFQFQELSEICMQINAVSKIFKYNDQSIMNYVFYKNYFKLNTKWNCVKIQNRKFNNNKLNNVINNNYILHFKGSVKPWNTKNIVIKNLWNNYTINTNTLNTNTINTNTINTNTINTNTINTNTINT